MKRCMWLLSLLLMAIAVSLPVGFRPVAAQERGRPAKGKKAPQGAAQAPVWPAPPEQPRVRYVTTYHGVGDFKVKRAATWKTMLMGQQEAAEQLSDVLVKPYGVTVSRDGRIYVTDTAARRVFAFDPDARTVGFVGESGSARVAKPIGVAVDDEGKVFVADATLNRVFAYAPDGSLALAMGGEGELKNPSGLAIDRVNKRVYVADAVTHQILCYSSVDGTLIRKMGRRGTARGEFNFPTNLTVDAAGRLYVADTLNFRIQIFDAEGSVLNAFGEPGDGPGALNRPKGIGIDSDGHIYVADASFNNFQIFDQDGRLLLFVGQGGRRNGEFWVPAGLYVDDHDRIYVVDQGNSRVEVFQYLKAGAK